MLAWAYETSTHDPAQTPFSSASIFNNFVSFSASFNIHWTYRHALLQNTHLMKLFWIFFLPLGVSARLQHSTCRYPGISLKYGNTVGCINHYCAICPGDVFLTYNPNSKYSFCRYSLFETAFTKSFILFIFNNCLFNELSLSSPLSKLLFICVL